MKKQNVHLICNAHLDPVWLWQWEEGVAEAISTFRTAVEFCENDKDFIFCHNEVILYKWVEQHEPQLFKRIQKQVKRGKWHIMGGWYLQPDCNMPSGESFIRQILLGREYFKQKFNKVPTTAINFDPFGHSQGLVQIMAKSGFDSYIFGRPMPEFLDLPRENFVWVGYDGSEIMADRFAGWYNTHLGVAAETIIERIKKFPDRRPLALLWGVGNHGGGPSRKDLKDVNNLIKEKPHLNIKHSTPENFFRELSKNYRNLPKVNRDLNLWAPGCYTSCIAVKQKQRLLENQVYSLEKMASAASVNSLTEYPSRQIKQIIEDLMLAQFHDILPGSSIEQATEDSLRTIEHALEKTSRLKLKAFLALSRSQKKAKKDHIPVMVYNHHPYLAKDTIECEFNMADHEPPEKDIDIDIYHKGKKIDSQIECERSNIAWQWRKRVVFNADLKPSSLERFDCVVRYRKNKYKDNTIKDRNGKIFFKTDDLNITINKRTGLIDKYRVNGKDFLQKDSFKSLIIKDNPDPWGMLVTSFRTYFDSFKLLTKQEMADYISIDNKIMDPVRIIEDGPVRTVIEAVFRYDRSFIYQRYIIPKKGSQMAIEMLVDWRENEKMLKLSVPTALKNSQYFGQVAYGVSKLPDDGTECVSQQWQMVTDKNTKQALTIIDDGIYGSDFADNQLRLSLVRSPIYACHPRNGVFKIPDDRYIPRTDQGRFKYKFWIDAGNTDDRKKSIDREALIKNQPPYRLSFFPNQIGKKPKKLISLSDDVIQVNTVKYSEKGNNLIIRLFEPTGRKRGTTVTLPALKKKIKVNLNAFEIKTLSVNLRTGKHQYTDLMEKKLT